jgi:tetratricopeptide (TPR) repeat protein
MHGLVAQSTLPSGWKPSQSRTKILPGYLVAHNNLAALLYENGDLEEAQAHYRAALRIRPTDPAANYNLGLLLHAKGDEKAAEHHLEMAWR